MDALLYWYTIILQEVPICNETNHSYNPQFLYRLWHLLSKSMVHSQTRHLTKKKTIRINKYRERAAK